MPDQDERPDHDADKAGEDSNRGEQKNDSNKNGGEGKSDDKPDDKSNGEKKGPGKTPLIILAVVVLLLIVGGLIWWFATRNQVSTDDAYTDGDAVTIAPKVSGYVVVMNLGDNKFVHKGDLLIKIDPRDYQAQLDQANAQLGQAQAQLNAAQVQLGIARVQYPAQLTQAKAQEQTAQANLVQTRAAYERQRAVDVRATSQQNIDTATAQQKSALANVASLRKTDLAALQLSAFQWANQVGASA